MNEDLQPPDQRMLRLHLESGRFRAGVVAGRWRLVSLEWPHVVIGVKARDGIEYGFRFHCADYPHTAVTAQPWDIENDSRLPAGRAMADRSEASLVRFQSRLAQRHVPLSAVRPSIDRRA